MLKGKALKDFEQWYDKKLYQSFGIISLPAFYGCPETMQQGVLLEFFRERGYEIEIRRFFEVDYNQNITDYYNSYTFQILHTLKTKTVLQYDYDGCDIPDYPTAFTHAIDKACELYGRGE